MDSKGVNGKIDIIKYVTQGTCSKMITIAVKDGVIQDIEFLGGCNGNLNGISSLVKGLTIDEVISRLQGITCGPKSTSCPDQLAQCLIEYKSGLLSSTNVG